MLIKSIAVFMFYLFLVLLWFSLIVALTIAVLYIANVTFEELTGINIAKKIVERYRKEGSGESR